MLSLIKINLSYSDMHYFIITLYMYNYLSHLFLFCRNFVNNRYTAMNIGYTDKVCVLITILYK